MGWWDRNIVEPGKLPLLLTCVAFSVTFLVTRTITRLIRAVAGVLVGTGSSLVLDEFAMILHMSDVYWQQAGQDSVQAVALTAMSLLAMLIGLHPFGVGDVGSAERIVRVSVAGAPIAPAVP